MSNVQKCTLGRSVVTTVNPSPTASNAPDQDNAPPPFQPHPRDAGLGNHKLAAGVDFQDVVPVVLVNLRNVSCAAGPAGVGHEDGNCRVSGGDLGILQDPGDEGAGGVPGDEVSLFGEEELLGILFA